MQIAPNKILRYTLFFVVVAATLYFLYLVREVVVSFAIGAILAYLLFRPVSCLEKRGLSRTWAILLLYVIASGGLSLLLWLATPRIVAELRGIAVMLPQYADQAQNIADQVDQLNVPTQFQQVITENTSKIEDYLYASLRGFVSGLYNFMSKLFIIIFAPILAFYILKDWEKIRDGFLKLLSPRARRDFLAVAGEIDTVLIEFIKGHLMVVTMVGFLTGLAAFIIGVRFALVIGIVSGITNLIPYFGPFLGAIPAIGLAMSESSRLAVYMIIAIIVIQQLESNIVTPRVIGDKLGLHPLVIVFPLLAGGQLAGLWGMLFAVPVTGILKVLVNYAFFKAVEK